MKKYFPASLNVTDRECLVIGEGRDAIDKSTRLRDCGARVKVVSSRQFRLGDIRDQFFVIFCPKDQPELAKKVADKCRRRRILLCAIDQPEHCDVVNVSTYDRGLFRIMASTHGAAPAVSRKIREGLEKSLKDVPLDDFLDKLATLRHRLKKRISDPNQRIPKLISATDGFNFHAKVTLPRNWRARNS